MTSFISESIFFPSAIKKRKDKNVYTSTILMFPIFCTIVTQIKGRIEINDVWEEGVDCYIWTSEGGSTVSQEKIA